MEYTNATRASPFVENISIDDLDFINVGLIFLSEIFIVLTKSSRKEQRTCMHLFIEKIATPGTTDSSRTEQGKLNILSHLEYMVWQNIIYLERLLKLSNNTVFYFYL